MLCAVRVLRPGGDWLGLFGFGNASQWQGFDTIGLIYHLCLTTPQWQYLRRARRRLPR
jgi:hypothetical protein